MEEKQSEKHTSSSEHKDSTPNIEKAAQDVLKNERLLATISYAAVGFVIPLITQPKNEKLQLHAKQGLIFFIGWLIILIILAASPILGLLIFLAYFALNVIALYRAYNGENWKIPLIGDFAEKISTQKFTIPTDSHKDQSQSHENKTQ